MCEVTKCCCCGLRTGCYVIGVFTIVVAAINIALNSYNIYQSEVRHEETQASVYVAAIAIVLAVIYLITAILLIVGASRRRKRLLIPWMVMVILFCLLTCITIILHIISMVAEESYRASLTNICILLLEIFLMVFCFSVVRSFYKNDCYDYGETRRPAPPKDGVYYTTVTQNAA